MSWTRKAHRALHVMRYEDMLASPDETFGALCMFLRLAPRPEELRQAVEKSSFERLRDMEDARGFTERPGAAARFFREGRAGSWKDHLTAPQIDAIVTNHREQMERFGYWPLR